MNTLYEHYAAATAEYLRRTQFKGVSPQTIQNYDSVLRLFGKYLAQQDSADDL